MSRLASLGRAFYALALFASGAQQVVTGKFVRLVPGFPAWIPAPWLWAVITGAILMAASVALTFDRRTPREAERATPRASVSAALAVGALLLATFLFLGLPQALSNPLTGFMWTNPCKTLALFGGALMLAGTIPIANESGTGLPPRGPDHGAGDPCHDEIVAPRNETTRGLRLLRPAGWFFLGVFLLLCGIQHFVYADFVDTLVPKWIPPGARFWTCVTGVALIAGGVGLMLPPTRRLAAVCSGVMVFLWVLLLHLPRTIELQTAFELAGVFEALAISGVCLLVAGQTSPAHTEPARFK